MVSLHIILNIKIVSLLASHLVSYKFGLNFGQIFYDYSGSGNHGQNGNTLDSDISDTIPIDRGAYFNTQYSLIKLPPNDIKPDSLKLGSDFSMIMWFYPLQISSYSYFMLRFRNDWANYIELWHANDLKKFYVCQLYSSYNNCLHTYDSNLVYSGIY